MQAKIARFLVVWFVLGAVLAAFGGAADWLFALLFGPTAALVFWPCLAVVLAVGQLVWHARARAAARRVSRDPEVVMVLRYAR